MTRAAIALVATLALCACGPPKTAVVVPPQPTASVSSIDRLNADLTALFTAPQFARSLWSVLVVPSDASAALFALNPAKLMMPASTMKIITAASAGELLGWDHQFETTLVTAAPVDRGVLRGDLIVIGGGDPSISERSDLPGTLRSIARRVREAGITHVEGGVVGHDDLFDDRGVGDGWTLDNIPYGYSAPVSALEYNEGSVDLVIRAGAESGLPVTISVRPEGSGLVVENRLVTVAESGTGALTLQRSPGSSHVVVQGQIPAKAPPFVRTASVDNPTRFFASALRHALIAEGVRVAGDAIDIDELQTKPDFSGARTLVAHKSPPLRQLVSSMMKVSQNQYAETLLRHLGLSRRRDNTAKTDEMGAIGASGAIGATAATGLPAVAMSETSAATGLPAVAMGETRAATGLPAVAMGETSAKAGAARAREVLQAWNISDDSLVIADGSGLSRYNYVTSEALVRILHVMRSDSRHATAFVDSLPLAGRDGTLARRLAGTAAEGKVRAKTGTVDNVRAIAGYVETADGETLLFSMIANNFTAANSTVDAAADSALVRLATFTRR